MSEHQARPSIAESDQPQLQEQVELRDGEVMPVNVDYLHLVRKGVQFSIENNGIDRANGYRLINGKTVSQ